MARSKGIIKFRGRVDDRVYYELNGKEVNRGLSGPTREEMDTNPNYKIPRNNALEFGGASKASKVIRDAMKEVFVFITDKTINNRLTSEFKIRIAAQAGDEATRPVRFGSICKKLIGFQFDPKYRVSLGFKFDFKEEQDSLLIKWKNNQMYSKGLRPNRSKASHVRFFLVAIALSDLEFDLKLNQYLPKNPAWHGLKKVEHFDYIEIIDETVDLKGEFRFDLQNAHQGDTVLMCCGLALYRKYGSTYDLLYTGNGIEVGEVYVVRVRCPVVG